MVFPDDPVDLQGGIYEQVRFPHPSFSPSGREKLKTADWLGETASRDPTSRSGEGEAINDVMDYQRGVHESDWNRHWVRLRAHRG